MLKKLSPLEQAEHYFPKDVRQHKMTVVKDDGVHRHLEFRNGTSSNQMFEIITWPGYLCYCGDMGTFVFYRLHDMVEFFRKSSHKGRPNYMYWAEKVEASCRDGIKEFSHDKFIENVMYEIKLAEDESRPESRKERKVHKAAFAEVRYEATHEICSCDDNATRAYDAANDFSHTGEAWDAYAGPNNPFEFTDFWEVNHEVYTLRFAWCCLALVWGIKKYDKHIEAKKKKEARKLPHHPIAVALDLLNGN